MRKLIKQLLRENIGRTIYRGGFDIDRAKVKSDGVSFSTNEEIAKYWASSNVNGSLFVYKLSPSAKILTSETFPETIMPRDNPYTHSDKERIVNYALVKGYDGVDLSGYFNEFEIRIFNLNVVTELKT